MQYLIGMVTTLVAITIWVLITNKRKDIMSDNLLQQWEKSNKTAIHSNDIKAEIVVQLIKLNQSIAKLVEGGQ